MTDFIKICPVSILVTVVILFRFDKTVLSFYFGITTERKVAIFQSRSMKLITPHTPPVDIQSAILLWIMQGVSYYSINPWFMKYNYFSFQGDEKKKINVNWGFLFSLQYTLMFYLLTLLLLCIPYMSNQAWKRSVGENNE